MQHLAAIATFIFQRIDNQEQTFDELKSACNASLHLQDDEQIRRALGISKRAAERSLTRVFGRVHAFDGSSLIFDEDPSGIEKKLVTRLAGTLTVKSAFTEDELITEFGNCATKNHLAGNMRLADVAKLRPFLSLYVIEKMHHSRIAMGSRGTASLQASADPASHSSTISVTGTIPVQLKHWVQPLVFPVFESTLDPHRWCEQEFLLPGSKAWEFPLEIGPQWKLRML